MSAKAVTRAEWLAARTDLLAEEKALTRAHDALAEKRRKLPRLRVETEYAFTGPNGRESLSDLFGPQSKLAVYHFMFGPDWQEGCPSCSFWADNFNGIDAHLAARDVRLVMVSAAPFETLDAYRRRMGWTFKWVSSEGTGFNRDMGVAFTPEEVAAGDAFYNFRNGGFPASEAPGLSFFQKDPDGGLYHTFSVYGRGLEGLNGAYQILHLAPKGRDEDDLPFTMAWLRRRDQYTPAV